MKVLIIDPWCSDKQDGYTFGLCEGLAENVELTLISGFYESKRPQRFKVQPLFFQHTQNMRRNKLRTILRGLEYIYSYLKILGFVRHKKFDIIHIEWALQYKIDIFFMKLLKNYCRKLIYTAHNAIPHENGEKYIQDLKKLHRFFDAILVHGEMIKKEYLSYFPEDKDKVKIQRHGVYLTQKTNYVTDKVEPKLIEFIKGTKGIIVACVGHIFYNKGTDRVINYWLKNEKGTTNKLIVAGKQAKVYKELENLVPSLNEYSNILYLTRFLNDDEFNYICQHCNIIAIPYRHASMSGIVYSSAAFAKPIVYTDTGAIREYVGNACCFRSRNEDIDFERQLSYAMQQSGSVLELEGKKLHDHIYEHYSWDRIAEKLVSEVYID